MTNAPWLSLLLPVYNVEPYLRQCVESIASQADEGVEIILVEDVSTDGSKALLLALQDELKGRLRLLQHGSNSGLSAARNTMLEAATGDYVWFFDSDDVLAPGALADLKSVIARDRPDLVMCDFMVLRERIQLKHRLRGELHRRTFQGPSDATLTDRSGLIHGLLEAGQLHAWSKISRRSLWGEDLRFPTGKYFEDQVVMPRLALRADSYRYVPRVWVAYRQRAEASWRRLRSRRPRTCRGRWWASLRNSWRESRTQAWKRDSRLPTSAPRISSAWRACWAGARYPTPG